MMLLIYPKYSDDKEYDPPDKHLWTPNETTSDIPSVDTTSEPEPPIKICRGTDLWIRS